MSGLTDLFAGIKFEVAILEGWSGISSPVNPWDKNIENIFSTSFSNLVLMNNFEGMIWPGQGVNTLINWDSHSGYNIKVDSDIILEFMGDAEDNLTFDIEAGWTFLPIPVPCEINTADLFSNYEDDLILIREISGFGTYFPDFNINTLEYLYPGKAYMLLASNPFTLEFEQCANTLKNATPANVNGILLHPEWGTVKATNAVHTLVVSQSALNNLKPGDIVGVFNSNGQCFGEAQYTGQPFAVSVFGDDITTTSLDGFETGGQFNLVLYRPNENTSFDVDAIYDLSLSNSDQFGLNGISAITNFKLGTNGLTNTSSQEINIQPNPSNGMFNISGIQNVVSIIIMTPEGDKIYENAHDGSHSTNINISGFSAGIYLIRLEGKGLPVIQKLIIN